MLPWTWATERLAAGRSYWVATTCPDGRPHAMPVWGVWLDEAVHFGTSRDSRKGRNLARDPRVVVHLESGDEVVILEGEVEETEIDERVADAYEAKYDWRPDHTGEDSGWYRLRPTVAYAWLEREYPRTATRFTFERE
jgi:nitroimidazol reductase NimA-like FMN-containing flavoprotein (pyridoxamine 5'-phosphate oxidase superfamily)